MEFDLFLSLNRKESYERTPAAFHLAKQIIQYEGP
ncbi:MAG: hypothetical protein JWN78_384 [Bacteroidota bacterium]|nr:hypothetical protein [Bacteroidota bacterium]